MCSASPPPPTDYAGAAQAQGAANLEAARATGRMNNPNVTGPTGSQSVTWEGDQPSITQTLNPQEQAIYNQNAQLRQSLGGLGLQGAGSLSEVIGKNLDMSGLPPPAAGSEAQRRSIIDAMMSRANEDFGQREDNTRSNLIAQGIPIGSEAYQREMTRIDRARNDARNQAELSAGSEAQRSFGMDSDARRNALAEMLTQRQTPLNEISALMSGGQVSNPFSMPGAAQSSNIAPAPTFAGAQAAGTDATNRYNAAQSGSNATTGAIGSMAGMAAMYFL